MPIDGPPQPGAAYECRECGELTIHYQECPTCGSDDLMAVD